MSAAIDELRKYAIATENLYVASHSRGGVKIGYSKNPKARIKELSTTCPHCDVELESVILVPGNLPAGDIESEIHKTFKDKQIDGEYFNVTVPTAIEICELMVEEFERYTDSSEPVVEKSKSANGPQHAVDLLNALADVDGFASREEVKYETKLSMGWTSKMLKRLESLGLYFPQSGRIPEGSTEQCGI